MNHKKGMPAAMAGGSAYPLMHPEIFYKLQPDIIAACDEMEKYGIRMPSQELVEQMVGRIHDSVCRKYPDLAKAAHEYEKNAVVPVGFTSIYGVQIKQMGLFGGLIAFLLLSEFFFRRRRRFRRRH